MKIGSLYRIAHVYTEASVLRKNLHGIWVKGGVNPVSTNNEWGVGYMRVEVGMTALLVADYNNRYGVFLVEDQFVELKYPYMEEL